MELEPFPVRYRRALADAQLQRNLLTFQRKWLLSRELGLGRGEVDFEVARQELKAVKDEVIDHLPSYLATFQEAAERAGAAVVRASSAADAVDYIRDLAKEHGFQRVIKSKSMVSEEIDLNHALEHEGIQVVETDLGEWIVQLAGERPSHIIGPALHKNRRQVAELFSRVTGREIDREDISAQVGVAREALRDAFLAGEMGISGANALVAETGTVMLVTNEGNAELVTSVPQVHVVLVGLEKLIPTLDDAMKQLRLLIPSATGQVTTSYVTWITGPTAPDQELHIVLLDNGRLGMRESPLFRDTLRCIRCGACSNICPSYGVVGGHVFGYVYSGAIGLVNTPFHNGLAHDAGPQSLCVSCNACQTVCPVDIPLPREILDVRDWVVREEGAPLVQRAALEVWARPVLARAALRAGATLAQPLRSGPFVRPPLMKKLTDWRTLPAPVTSPFRDRWAGLDHQPLPGELGEHLAGVTIAYFVQCLTDWLYPEMGEAIVGVLRALGARVVFPRAQHCCGLPALDSGQPAQAKRLARQTIRTLEGVEVDYVVSGGTSCVIAMLHEYAHLFRDEPEWQMRAGRLAERTYDFTSFMARVATLPAGSLPAELGVPATYHYFCQSYNVLGFRQEPIELLAGVSGVELTPLPEANVCCGFGGSVSFKRPELTAHILERKLDNLDESEARVLITDNPGCIMQFRGGIDASGRQVHVLHTAEVLARGVQRRRTEGP